MSRLSPTAWLRVGLGVLVAVLIALALVAELTSSPGDDPPDAQPGVSTVEGRGPTTASRMGRCLQSIAVKSTAAGSDRLSVTLPSGRRIGVRLASSGAAAHAAGARFYVNNVELSVPGTELSQLDRHVLFNCSY